MTVAGRNLHIGLLILRLGIGALILTHGLPKFLRLIEGNMQFSDPLGLGSEITFLLAVFAEFVCAILIILGVYTRLAVIPLLATMLTAALIAHAPDPFGTKEKALLYAVAFLTLLFTGGGKYSLYRRF